MFGVHNSSLEICGKTWFFEDLELHLISCVPLGKLNNYIGFNFCKIKISP